MAGAVSKPVELVFIRDNTRRYAIWEGEIDGQHIVIHGFGALFPERYLPSRSAEASIWHCPVRTCGQAFATPPDLGDHFLKFHAGAILHDHLDGTFSVLPQDPKSDYDANRQPYVASQGRMLQSPSLRQPSQSVPLQPGPGALDTPAVPVDNHDLSNPQTGNKPPASSSEVNSDDESDGSDTNESDGSSDNDSDGSDTNESDDDADDSDGGDDSESDESDADESDGNDDNESNGSDADETKELPMPTAYVDTLPMGSQDPNPKKRKANNDKIAPEPKKAKPSQALVGPEGKRVKEWDMKHMRMSKSGTQPAEWETKWRQLPHSGQPLHSRPPLAYSSIMLTSKRVVADNDTTFQIVKIPQGHEKSFQAYNRALLFVVKQGAVSVLVTENQLFTISTDGCWSIKRGQSSTMKGMHPETETVVYIYGRPG